MRISVLHSTVFRYDAPVVLEPHVFRLRPREDGTQRLIRHDLEILPEPQGRSLYVDPAGNAALQAWFSGEVSELSVRSSFEIETLRQNPFDFLLPAPGKLRTKISQVPDSSDSYASQRPSGERRAPIWLNEAWSSGRLVPAGMSRTQTSKWNL